MTQLDEPKPAAPPTPPATPPGSPSTSPPASPDSNPKRGIVARRMANLVQDVYATFQGKAIMDARRRRNAKLFAVGTAITLSVLLADIFHLGGVLTSFENYLYDQRCYYFQAHIPPPTDQLVHIDIDDTVLEAQDQRWPWPRSKQAAFIRELSNADPKVIFLDITYQEADKAYPAEDAALVKAIKDSGRILSPVTLNLAVKTPQTNLEKGLIRVFRNNLDNFDDKSIISQLEPKEQAEIVRAELPDRMQKARKTAARQLVTEALAKNPTATAFEVAKAIIPTLEPDSLSRAKGIIEHEYTFFRREEKIVSFAIPTPPNTPPAVPPNSISAPIAEITQSAFLSGFVDYIPTYTGDSKVRYIPLFVDINGKLFPHVALGMTCAYRGISLDQIKIEPDKVIVPDPRPGGQSTAIPIRTLVRADGVPAGYIADIPWFGGRRWETMYDYPAHQESKQHLSLAYITNVIDTEERINVNIQLQRKLILEILDVIDPEGAPLQRTSSARFNANDLPRFRRWVDRMQDSMLPRLEPIRLKTPRPSNLADDQPSPNGERSYNEETALHNFSELLKLIPKYRANNDSLKLQWDALRADVKSKLQGKIILVGFTATGLVDQYPTSIHAVAPGVTAHGAMVNGILTNHFWKRAPRWYAHALTILLGLTVTLFLTSDSVLKASLGFILCAVGYVILNGAVLFDRYNLVVDTAGPITAMAIGFTGVGLFRYWLEKVERAQITARFTSYVDKELVEYIQENLTEQTFAGREQNMTVVFTDLEGFTTLSEKLKAGAIPILNDYVGRMVPIVRKNKGFLDKFLGDGIMFEFNTVRPNPSHASDAIRAVLQMQEAMHPLNASLKQRDLPTLRMRVGINTGDMIVGDAGSITGPAEHRAANFTVLGDPVNLAARLEGANKPFGTLILLTKDTLDQTKGEFAVRPIASIRVKGKEEAVRVYEPICPAGQETDAQKLLISLTTKVFDTFTKGDLEACMKACDDMDAFVGPSKFTTTYHKECVSLLANGGTGPDWDGTISLTEK